MKLSNGLIIATALVLVASGSALASKTSELTEWQLKPWSLLDLPEFAGLSPLADVNETEGLNDTCPGEPYLLGDVYHATLTPGDQDWICFPCNAGDLITVGTDTDGGASTDTYLELYADDCSTQLTFNDDGGPGLFSLILDFPAPYTGNYYVKVRGFSTTTQGPYILVATCETPPPPVETVCPLDDYKGLKYGVNLAIPDNDPAGVTVGPLQFFPDGTTILDLVLDFGISHTWVGDLVVTVTHIGPCGTKTVDLINRPGVPGSTYGCSGDLIGSQTDKYYFGTNPALLQLGEDECPAAIPVQCYEVAPENPNGLIQWRGCPKDGQWYLTVSDNAGGDVGTLWDFSVHVLNQGPVSVESASWGSIKAGYR
jgi:subtilisin-like proprotein convertase family protein